MLGAARVQGLINGRSCVGVFGLAALLDERRLAFLFLAMRLRRAFSAPD